jgi:hypothetical protein
MFSLTEENTAYVMDDEVAMESNDLFINIARAWALVSSGIFWCGYVNYTKTISSVTATNPTDAAKTLYTGVNSYKYTSWIIYLSMLWGAPTSIVWLANVFLGGKGGPLMQAAVIFSKVGGIVGIL